MSQVFWLKTRLRLLKKRIKHLLLLNDSPFEVSLSRFLCVFRKKIDPLLIVIFKQRVVGIAYHR